MYNISHNSTLCQNPFPSFIKPKKVETQPIGWALYELKI